MSSSPSSRKTFSSEEALDVAGSLRIDWTTSPFDVEQFRLGLDVELEHGSRDPQTDVTGDDPILTGKIALAHLRELPDYYTRLAVMEGEDDPKDRDFRESVRNTRAFRVVI